VEKKTVMRKYLWLITLLLLLSACQTCQRQIKYASWRKITLYSADGKIIKEWNTQGQVETSGSIAAWLQDGKDIKISGTFVIEEL
jgi:starvation-inducible outer membrane lipoprotein